ncbi:MAG: hypothetical protein R2762_01870 [Bryobacteraceae bacterium]
MSSHHNSHSHDHSSAPAPAASDSTSITGLIGLRNKAFFVGLLGVVACLAGLMSNSEQFLRSYLIGFIYWLLIAVTCNALLFLHHLVGGQWGVIIRRLLEAGARTIPFNALLMIPILLNLPTLYEWARPEHVAHDPILIHKSAWLNPGFFTGRMIFYFAVWTLMGYLLNKWSREQENGGGEEAKNKLRALSGPGILIHGMTLTFAAFDLGMSIEPHWPSTMYGVLYIIGGALATMAFLIIVVRILSDSEPMAGLLKPKHFHDLGTLLFAFVVLWAYVNFSQFLIIWSGNLPEETVWYLKRGTGMWQAVSLVIMTFHFAVPFFLLLMRFNKKNKGILVQIAAFMLVMRLLDLVWLIAPGFHEVKEAGHHMIHWLDVAAPVAIGGLWVGLFAYLLGQRPVVPVEVARLTGGHH